MTNGRAGDGDDPEGESADGSDLPVSPAEVEHVAELARIDVAELDAGREAFAREFAEILAYFETLDDVPAVDREADLVNVMREDEVAEGLTQEEALANAPETEDGRFKGPRVS